VLSTPETQSKADEKLQQYDGWTYVMEMEGVKIFKKRK
jgi:hypothetical protein